MEDPRSVGSYSLVHKIGRGSYAQVWYGRHKLTNAEVAIKILAKTSLTTLEGKTRSEHEMTLHQHMRHLFITECFETIEDKSYLYFVLEYVDNGNLQELIQRHGKLSEDVARCCFTELVSALEYLHGEKKVVHGNLNARNVLVDKAMNVRVTDFGLSSDVDVPESEFVLASSEPDYTSPEVIKGQPYSVASDVWSAGVLLFLMTVGCLPYEDQIPERLLQKIVFSDVFYPAFLSPTLVDLLKRILVKDPEMRISLDEIKRHAWLQQGLCSQILGLDSTMRRDVDRQIVAKMAELGFDENVTREALAGDQVTPVSALYRVFARQKEMAELRDFMEKLRRLQKQGLATVKPAFMFNKKRSLTNVLKSGSASDASQDSSQEAKPSDMDSPKSQPVIKEERRRIPKNLGMAFRRNRTMQVPFPVQIASQRMVAGHVVRSSTPVGGDRK